ncbi:hypothetical protein [Leifsonia kafniensis]|uniref:hypothetical protein n=1 Tax=Leifsonia kafniensis TaxID=475957 RepID=UPI0031E9AABA
MPAPEPPAIQIPPRLTAFGWVGSDSVICPDMTSNHVVVKDFSWTAADASTVDLYVAMTDSEVQATSGYVVVASGLSPSGVAGVPISCGSSGLGTFFTVKIVATNASGSAAAHWRGATGL